MFNKGSYIAVKSDEEPFWIAKCLENVNDDSCKAFKIKWFERISANQSGILFALGNEDEIFIENIICGVKLYHQGRFKFLLHPEEQSNVLKKLEQDQSSPNAGYEEIEEHVATSSDILEKQIKIKPVLKNEEWVNEYLMTPHNFETKCTYNDFTVSIDTNHVSSQLLNIELNINPVFEGTCDKNEIIPNEEDNINKAIQKKRNSMEGQLETSVEVITKKPKCIILQNVQINGTETEQEDTYYLKELQSETKYIQDASQNESTESTKQLSLSFSDLEEEPFQSSGSEYKPNTSSDQSIEISDSDSTNKKIKVNERVVLKDIGTFTQSKEIKSSISVTMVTKSLSGGRKYDKRHACYFCDKLIGKVTRHLETVHRNEIEVAKLLAMDKDSKQRKNEFICLLRAGDYYHNSRVLATGNGQLLLSRRPSPRSEKQSIKDFGPCPNCLGFFALHTMWKHVKQNCPNKKDKISHRDIRAESYALLSSWSTTYISEEFTKHILSAFRSDDISNICKTDELIIKLGALMFEKYTLQQYEYIRQTMRQLARLVIQLRESNIYGLSQALLPENFDALIQAVNKICISSVKENASKRCGIPTLALKLGYSLRKCAYISRSLALRKGDLKMDKAMKHFLQIMSIDWSYRVSSTALRSINDNKLNKSQNLPLTEDIIKLNKYLDMHIQTTINLLKTKIEIEFNWFKLAGLVLARLIIFNKRRSGEVARMSLKQYSSRPDWKNQATTDLKQSLTPLEVRLADRLTVVEVTGKSRKNFKVPILMTPEMKEAVNMLIEIRELTSIDCKNTYVFATGNGSLNNIRGHDVLRKHVRLAELEKPEYITSTKLRKYVATVVQILDLKENETDWLARHLGHDIKIHRDFYRLHESTVELTKVSRLLIAVDEGKTASFKGKSLEDIDLDREVPLPNAETIEIDSDMENMDDISGQEDIFYKTTVKKEASHIMPTTSIKTKKKKNTIPKKWSPEEIETVLSFFKHEIKKKQFPGKLPGKLKCEELLKSTKIFGNRPWTDIKYFVHRYIQRLA